MSLLWTPNLATGIDWQDAQHKKLFEEINTFIASIKQKRVQDCIRKYETGKLAMTIDLMNFLRDWLKEHISGTDKNYSRSFGSKRRCLRGRVIAEKGAV